MPYIPQGNRAPALKTGAMDGGELTYVFLKLAREYISRINRGNSSAQYKNYAEVIAALEVTKHVFMTEDLGKYEAIKRHENGDVTAP